MNVRTRFAPSPTGYLHIGGIRTALFAWLYAKKNNGQFILRIEDTDQQREVKDSVNHIIESLEALGLDFDEGPYFQSERISIYHQWAEKLVNKGLAYSDPYSKDELDAVRQEDIKNKIPFLYRNHRQNISKTWDKSKALRFKSNPKDYKWHDQVMGDLQSTSDAIDDFILIKEDGFPTYNFAHIIDDHLMKISHIVRSQEFLASIPKYLNLYEAFEISVPEFITVPQILRADGKKKLSKRDNSKDILEYLKEGYLKESLISYLATLGWNDGSEQEIFSIQELVQKFSIEHVQRSPAQYDEKKLSWVNGLYIRALTSEELDKKLQSYWSTSALKHNREYRIKVLEISKDRLKLLSQINELVDFFFMEPTINDSLIKENRFLSSIPNIELIALLEKTYSNLQESTFSVEDLTNRLNKLLQELNQKPAILFSLIRIATTQSPSSPGLFDSLNVIGKEKSLNRINDQIKFLKDKN